MNKIGRYGRYGPLDPFRSPATLRCDPELRGRDGIHARGTRWRGSQTSGEPPISTILFTPAGMSPRNSPEQVASRIASHAGITIGDARRGRRWTLRELAARARVSPSMLHAVEHGAPASLATYAAIGAALGLEAHLDLIDPRRRAPTARAEDPVHAAMGERIAARLAGFGVTVAIDEPYQHFQFAGRADVLAWDLDRRALLHVETRPRFRGYADAAAALGS